MSYETDRARFLGTVSIGASYQMVDLQHVDALTAGRSHAQIGQRPFVEATAAGKRFQLGPREPEAPRSQVEPREREQVVHDVQLELPEHSRPDRKSVAA